MEINQATVDLVKSFEGLKLKAYRDDVGVWTIGYGTTGRAGVGITPRAGMTITEPEADEYLRRGLEKFAAEIRPKMKRRPTANEFGAMLSLAYNIGPGAFGRSTVLREFNAGNAAAAADAFRMWNRAGGRVLNGLVRRREAERKLFLTPSAATPTEPQDAPQRGLLAALVGILKVLFGGRS